MNSNLTDPILNLFWLTVLGSILVGLLVSFLLVYFVYKYRDSKDVPRNKVKNEFKFEVAWTTLAIVLALILIVLSTPVVLAIQNPETPEDAEVIHIQAYRFGWRKMMDNGSVEISNLAATGLQLDVGQQYMLNLTSRDSPSSPGGVIHSFYSYDLSFKIDAIPGKQNHFYFTIDEPGDYRVTCAEFCGSAHYTMQFTITAS